MTLTRVPDPPRNLSPDLRNYLTQLFNTIINQFDNIAASYQERGAVPVVPQATAEQLDFTPVLLS